jgi:formylglycine-generating enzyme required for sulfatase activity
LFWSRDERGWAQRSLVADRPLEEVFDWPISVTWVEARAFLLWGGRKRLPTEAEFHRAAYGAPGATGSVRSHPWGDDAPHNGRGNFGYAHWEPTAVGAHPASASAWGVHELVGNGWEWTSTAFAPFPGFAAHPAYPEYSRDFFDGRHYVMLGASWATDPALTRRSFRNWFQAHYPYVFAKFRGVSPE